MPIHFVSSWPLFCVAFGGMLFLTLIMKWQSTRFYTQDVVLRKFSIMELEMPATQMELVNLIKGLYKLPPATSAATVKALKGQLYTDFLFMPFAYGGDRARRAGHPSREAHQRTHGCGRDGLR